MNKNSTAMLKIAFRWPIGFEEFVVLKDRPYRRLPPRETIYHVTVAPKVVSLRNFAQWFYQFRLKISVYKKVSAFVDLLYHIHKSQLAETIKMLIDRVWHSKLVNIAWKAGSWRLYNIQFNASSRVLLANYIKIEYLTKIPSINDL